MKIQIKRFSIHQTSKVLTVCYVAIGLLFIPFGVLMIIGGQTTLGIVYVLMPLIYAVLGYPFAAFMCWVYNFVAKAAGGIEITAEEVVDAAPAPRGGGPVTEPL